MNGLCGFLLGVLLGCIDEQRQHGNCKDDADGICNCGVVSHQLAAVSYTHLDVYKRQVAALEEGPGPLAVISADTAISIMAVNVKQELVGGVIPVSYTHLDVYKRQ